MKLVIPEAISSTSLAPTPVEFPPDLAAAFDLPIDLCVKRDDLYPLSGGGIKARKATYLLREAVAESHDVLITTGGPQSNHARAIALEAARLGIRCHLLITPHEPESGHLETGNLALMEISGAKIEWCRKQDLALRMNETLNQYQSQGFNPWYIWGGGHCLPGVEAFVDAAGECLAQLNGWIPDYIVLASGTGSTQGGLAIGFAPAKVIGISVAREKTRGLAAVQESMEWWSKSRGGAIPETLFYDDWTDGGYGKVSPELCNIVRQSGLRGFLLDTTYSGKGWRGLVELVRRVEIEKGSRVLFWHTGGLMNLLARPLENRWRS